MRRSIFGKLSPDDVALVLRYGRERSLQSTRLGAKNKQLDRSRSNVEIHTLGIAGEFALSRSFGIEPIFLMAPEGRKPDQFIAGLRFDVKATVKPHGRLMVYIPRPGENEYENVDAFACCRFPFWSNGMWDYELTGWAHKYEVCRKVNVEDVGHGDTWFVNDGHLRDFAEIGYVHPSEPPRQTTADEYLRTRGR